MTGPAVAFVADPLESLDPATDTTIGLMHAAQDRGCQVWVTQARALELVGGRVRAAARRVRLAPSRPAGGCRWTVPDPWLRAGPAQPLWLDRMSAVFIRTEPPVDRTYLDATLILDLLDPERTRLINDPRGLRACNEHTFPLQFPDLVPPTVLTADPASILAFLDEYPAAVLKPVDGYAGRGVLLLERRDRNLGSLLEISTEAGRRAVLVQQYLPEVAEGNKRIFLLDGEPVAAVYRFPEHGDFRIGNPSTPAPITGQDRRLCARIAPALARNGLRMVGLDVIGRYLIEANVTSPGALRKADALLGGTLCADLLDHVLSGAGSPATSRPSSRSSVRPERRRPA